MMYFTEIKKKNTSYKCKSFIILIQYERGDPKNMKVYKIISNKEFDVSLIHSET